MISLYNQSNESKDLLLCLFIQFLKDRDFQTSNLQKVIFNNLENKFKQFQFIENNFFNLLLFFSNKLLVVLNKY